jgi:hypothetical protein
MNISEIVTLNLRFFVITLFLLSITGVFTVLAEDTFDDSIYVGRSNVMSSRVDPSFWDERESLSIGKVEKPLVLPQSNPKTPTVQSGSQVFSPSGKKLTTEELAVITKSQEVALLLVNIPNYQAGDSVFKLDDDKQIRLSSMKYAVTQKYYGRTDISSSWVTDFYNAAYSDDYNNLSVLLEDLPAEN